MLSMNAIVNGLLYCLSFLYKMENNNLNIYLATYSIRLGFSNNLTVMQLDAINIASFVLISSLKKKTHQTKQEKGRIH